MAGTDYYRVLGVGRSATEQEIQSAYRRLARRYHPDVNDDPGAEERFKQINEAYEVLSDERSRARYDHDRAAGGGRRVRVNTTGGGDSGGAVDLEDLLGGVFGGAGGFGRGRRVSAAGTDS